MTPGLPLDLRGVLDELDYSGHEGLVTSASDVDPGPRGYLWRDLHSKVGLEAAFFHDGVPVVGFSAEGDEQGLTRLRRRLWNYGRVPLLVNVSPDATVAFNAVTIPTQRGTGEAEVLAVRQRTATAQGLLEGFRRSAVVSGSFASQYDTSFKAATRVDDALLSNLKYLRSVAANEGEARRQALDVVIWGCLIASYLVDRGILTDSHMSALAGAQDLQSILVDRKRALTFFSSLAEKFNGDVFGPVPSSIRKVSQRHMLDVASLLRGDNLATGQLSLWPYDFSVLPADLVSRIYEQLLEESRNKESAYYTPTFLVQTILDEIIPWTGESQPTIIDLACGSGAFMTEAFRRMAYRARIAAGRDLTYQELHTILQKNIFGVELNVDSARIAIFGLYLALLEELDPPTIWEQAVLPRLLNQNVVVSDAFSQHPLSEQKFDAVVGNPPWQSKLSEPAEDFVKKSRLPVADKQIASAFLWLAVSYLNPCGKLGLVMPAKALLHNKSRKALAFRAAVFERLDVKAIVDLSAVRRTLFADAIAPATLVIARAKSDPPSLEDLEPSSLVLHIAVHHRPLSSTIDTLVVAPEEVRSIGSRQAQHRPEIWKVLLWGGIRDLEFIDRLRLKYPTVGQVCADRGWTCQRGYQVVGGDNLDATPLIGLPMVPTDAVTLLRLDMTSREPFWHTTLHRPRKLPLYKGPHVLVRRTLVDGRLAAAFTDEDCVFPDGMLGFAGPHQDRHILMALAVTAVSSLGNYFHFMTSSSWGVERSYVELNEHLSLPLAFPDQRQSQALDELIVRAREEVSDSVLRDIDELVFDLYDLSPADRARIRERVTYDLVRFDRQNGISMLADEGVVSVYAETLRETVAATLPDIRVESRVYSNGPYWAVALAFVVDDIPRRQREFGEVDIARIVEANAHRSRGSTGIIAQPAGFFVDEDTVYLVKTSDRDRWSRDAALDDAERVVTTLAFGS